MPRTTDPGSTDPARTGPVSIQGERHAARHTQVWASDGDVDAFVASLDDGPTACRERGRHQYQATNRAGMSFSRVTPEGWYERRVPCESCRHVERDGSPGPPRVVRIELWDVQHHRGKITRCVLVSSRPEQLDASYAMPAGQGRAKPRQVRNATASAVLAGHSVTELRREIDRAERERARLTRERYLAQVNASAQREVAQLSLVNDTA